MARTPRQLNHLKAARIITGRGIPRRDEGSDGDLTLRITSDGLKLFAKYQNKWYVVGEHMREAALNDRTLSTDSTIPSSNPARFTKSGDVAINVGSKVSFDSRGGGAEISSERAPNTDNRNLIATLRNGAFYIKDRKSAAGTPKLIIKNDANNLSGGVLTFINDRDGAGGAANIDNDNLGFVLFQGYNSSLEEVTYGYIQSYTIDVTNATEAGQLEIGVVTKDAGGGGSGLDSGILMQGSDTNDTVNVTIASGATSMTTIAGDLDIDGDKVTSVGALEIETGGSGDLTLDVAGNIIADVAGGQFTIQDSDAADPDLVIKSTGTHTAGGTLQFIKDRGGDAGTANNDNDIPGTIYWYGYNDAGTPELKIFGQMKAIITDATDSAELGKVEIGVLTKDAGGTGSGIETGLKIEGTIVNDRVDVTIGNGTASMTTIAGNLDIDGSKITTAGNIELESGNDVVIDSGGDITLDSHDGNFIAKKAGTEFSVANSAYAGMILGYTTVGRDAAPDTFSPGTSMTPVDDALKVTFKAPPSGAVEVFVSIVVEQDQAGRNLMFGLSTTDASTGFTTLEDIYEDFTFVGGVNLGGGDVIQHTHRWVVTGLTAGAIDTYWFAAGSEAAGRTRLRWGGNATAIGDYTEPYEYAPFIMKVTALPAATTDYAVYG